MLRAAMIAVLALGLSGCVYANVAVTRASHLTVVDDVTEAPIAGVKVTIGSVVDPRLQASGVTDSAGHVDLPSVSHREAIAIGSLPDTIDENLSFSVPGYHAFRFQSTYNSPRIPERCLTVGLLPVGVPRFAPKKARPLEADCGAVPALSSTPPGTPVSPFR